MEAAVDEDQMVLGHVTDLQQPPAGNGSEASAAAGVARCQNGELPLSPDEASDYADAVSAAADAGSAACSSGLATPAAKRRRYRNLFGNIGKLITFNRRKQPASPSSAARDGDHLAERSELQLPTGETCSLDLIVPDAEILCDVVAEDPITGQVSELEILEPVAKEAAEESSSSNLEEELSKLLELHVGEKSEEKGSEPGESLAQTEEQQSADEKKKKMEYDMSLGGISTIMEETEEAVVKAQTVELPSEGDLIKLESEIDLADFDSQKQIHEQEVRLVKGVEVREAAGKCEKRSQRDTKAVIKSSREELDGKVSRVVELQNQTSESDSGYGCSTSDSPIEVEVDRHQEKPQQPPVEEVEGSSGGSDVFAKEVEEASSVRSAAKSKAPMSPSDEELAYFEKAEVCVEDSMVDLVDINVKLDSLLESNRKLSRSGEPAKKSEAQPDLVRLSESLEDEDDEEMEPVELDLSSNQSVRRRKFIEAKARRQMDLEAARRQQADAMACASPDEDCDYTGEASSSAAAVRDKDIVDGLGKRRHSHEAGSACAEGSDGAQARMRSRLPVRRSASCPRRTVEDYATYIRSKKPVTHLVESSYSPVKIDFRPLTREAQETHGAQLTQQGTGGEPKPSQAVGQTGRRAAGKKVHFNSATVDQVVTYAAAAVDSDEMKQVDGGENGQHLQARARQVVGGPGVVRAARYKAGEAEKPSGQHDRSLIKSISVKQTLASRKRLEKLHDDAVKQLGMQDDSQYMTPLQRKDLEVRELKRQLDEAYFVVEQRELELDVFHHEKVRSIEDAVRDRDERIACLQVQISQLESDFSALRAQHSDICTREKRLAESLDQLRTDCADRERRHQDLYLEMYKKGRDSVRFERQDEIEKLAVLEPDKVAMEELLEKLEITQHDLQKWQSIKLKEVYEDSDKAATEADAKLSFLRDSMFHYLTERDREQNQQHLTAMIGIFSFTDVQMKHIVKSMEERRKKGKI